MSVDSDVSYKQERKWLMENSRTLENREGMRSEQRRGIRGEKKKRERERSREILFLTTFRLKEI